MATVLKRNRNRNGGHLMSFSGKLFVSVISLFLVFVTCFLVYQYQREKEYKVELLHTQLQDWNERLDLEMEFRGDSAVKELLDGYVDRYANRGLRLTVINRKGEVLYDSSDMGEFPLENHIGRPEIQRALVSGSGYDVRRLSETTGVPYFYSATLCGEVIIRSALPYDVNLIRHLAADRHYLWFTLLLTLVLLGVFYKFTAKLGMAVSHLREFAKRADRNEPIGEDDWLAFPHNELGEISQHIIQIYRRLRETKEALYIEREKLIAHLQTAREGLGVFNREKKEILVNGLFTQYANLISDRNLQATEDIFGVAELAELTEFIDKAGGRAGLGTEEMRRSLHILKNGRVFVVECIVFQDLCFEISINDITQEEEQSRLKRQLTQNIAHELKTPVSSIQGYLETMVANVQLPPEKFRVFLERCYAQSNRLTRLLRDISVLTRMDEAANLIDMEKVDVSLLVNSMVNEVALDLEKKGITVVNSLKPGMVLRGNYSLLYSIFRNLTDNAIAYAGTGIRIEISCFREDEHFYYFSFADTGVGVPPEHLNRLFERFYRVDKGRSRKMGGTGLGLAIVKNAVLIHGGSISAKNRPGGGLEFVFTLSKELVN